MSGANPMAASQRRPTKSGYNPNAPRDLMILNRNRIHFLRLLRFFSRSRGNESAGPAQGEAQQNDRDFQCQRHESASALSHTFTAELLPIAASK